MRFFCPIQHGHFCKHSKLYLTKELVSFWNKNTHEMRFFFEFETYQTWSSVLIVLSISLSLTLPIQVTRKGVMFLVTMTPIKTVSYVENKFQLRHIWKAQSVSKIQSSSGLDLPLEIANISPSLKYFSGTSTSPIVFDCFPSNLKANFLYSITCFNPYGCVISSCNRNKLDY